MLSDGSEVVATIIGSIAAALECEVDGNIPVSRESMLQKIDRIEKQAHYSH